MIEGPKTVGIWELSCERKKRDIRTVNRATLTVVAPSLSEAMTKAASFVGDEWTVWSARHVGQRVVIL
jgi:hypothetical protein